MNHSEIYKDIRYLERYIEEIEAGRTAIKHSFTTSVRECSDSVEAKNILHSYGDNVRISPNDMRDIVNILRMLVEEE
jgi:hypothetical protein